MGEQLNLLASIRLSNLTDATTSPVTQRAEIQDFADDHGHSVVAWTEDYDVSGAIPIRERDGIGPWLADENLSMWDALIGYRLDRLFRSQLDFLLWCRDFGDKYRKIIIDVEGGIDTSTPQGKRALNDRARDADYERQRMSERRAKAAKRIRQAARWGGGSVTFGYEPYKDGNYWYLRPSVYQAETERMATLLLSGKSAGQIAADLNRRGVPTARDAQLILMGKAPLMVTSDVAGTVTGIKAGHPRKVVIKPDDGSEPVTCPLPGRSRLTVKAADHVDAGQKLIRRRKWTSHAVIHHLRSEALRGVVLHYRQPGKPERVLVDGQPVRRAPLLDDDTWDAVQRALDANGHQTCNRAGRSLLLQVAFCGHCGEPLYQARNRKHGGKGDWLYYYQCAAMRTTCEPSKSIRREHLEGFVEDILLSAVGDCERTETRIVHGDDHSKALAEVGREIASLTTERFVNQVMRPDYDDMMASLQAEHARLSALPRQPDRPETIHTGITVREYWNGLDDDGKHKFLRDSGIRVVAEKWDDNLPHLLDLPRLLELAGSDDDGQMKIRIGDGLRMAIVLGSLGKLRKLARQA
jgi:site-specific DNA recombinase